VVVPLAVVGGLAAFVAGGFWLLQRGGAPKPVDLDGAASHALGGDADDDEEEGAETDPSSFARAMLRAARDAGLEAEIDDERYVLTWKKGELVGELELSPALEAYEKLAPNERPAFLRARASHIVPPPLPPTYAEAEARLVPILRDRVSFEVARIAAAVDPATSLPPEPPHVAIGEAVWGALALETDEQFVRVDAVGFGRWSVPFEKAWQAALARLKARSVNGVTHIVGSDGVLGVTFGDDNASARALVYPALAPFVNPGKGDFAVATPRADVLLAVPATDADAIDALADQLVADEGASGLRLLRVGIGGPKPLVLPASHPAHDRVVALDEAADAHDEEITREAIQSRYGDREGTPYVARPMHVANPTTNDEFSAVVLTEGQPTLLTRAEWVVFQRVDLAKKTSTTLACAPWAAALRLMTSRWKETALWPRRWLAADFPTPVELAALGCAHPALKQAVGVPEPTEP
jgi:hypothetical protein